MSDNDAFDRAVRALREEGEISPADVARTRTRVLDTLHRGERRGRRTFWVLLPIAAVLAGGAAFAKNSEVGQRVWTQVAETVGIRAAAENSPHAVRSIDGRGARANTESRAEPVNAAPHDLPSATPLESAAQAAAASTEPATAAEMGPAPEAHVPQHASSPRGVAAADQGQSAGSRRSRGSAVAENAARAVAAKPSSEAVETEAPGAAAVANDGEAASLQLYKNAYRLHFVEQRYAAALTAWDEYLRASPTGRLVVEARYNRAIALVRLGRRAEAETALAPFARGEVSGGYRAREARELLDVLNEPSR